MISKCILPTKVLPGDISERNTEKQASPLSLSMNHHAGVQAQACLGTVGHRTHLPWTDMCYTLESTRQDGQQSLPSL